MTNDGAMIIQTLFALALCGATNLPGGTSTMTDAAGSLSTHEASPAKYWVYIGTYTGKGSKGIYIYQLDPTTGKLTPAGTGPMVTNPSFLAAAPDGRHLYAVNEVDELNGQKGGAVSAFKIDPHSGALTFLNEESVEGGGSCHISVDRSGRYALAANYGGGSLCVLPIRPDGTVGKATAFIQHTGKGTDPGRQEGPHAHSIYTDPEGKRVYSADLGLDKVFIYQLDGAKGTLAPNEPPYAEVAPGSGPRHIAFHRNGRDVYVINEMACTVTAFHRDAHTGGLTSFQTVSTLPEGMKLGPGDSTAEIEVSPNGKFLYGSNRGHNTIAIFSIDPGDGKLTYVGEESTQGKTPRGFGIDPTGTILLAANQDSDNVVVFRIDPATGRLTATGDSVTISMPVCVLFVPEVQR